ncbi:MAG: hypothetical protein KIG95_01155 [Comamonas sp.]|nr:hypothetical protein [Comamonas sp.]
MPSHARRLTAGAFFGLVFVCQPFAIAGENSWPAYNRSLKAQWGALEQDYAELDRHNLTQTGILDAETGSIRGLTLLGRWQSKNLPLWVQLSYGQHKGQTHYQGHIQNGTVLLPFKAKTGNRITHTTAAIGFPIAIAGGTAQVIPYIELGKNRWQRNLLQYKERYSTQTTGIGLLTQWRISKRWVLEAGAQLNRQHQATVRVDAFQFVSPYQSTQMRKFDLGLVFQINDRMHMGMHWSDNKFRSHPSEIINGLQAPPSRTQQQNLFFGIGWHY